MVSPFVQGAGARVLKEPRSVCQYKNDDPRRDEWLEGWYFVVENIPDTLPFIGPWLPGYYSVITFAWHSFDKPPGPSIARRPWFFCKDGRKQTRTHQKVELLVQ